MKVSVWLQIAWFILSGISVNIQTSFNVFTEIYNTSGQLVVVGTKEKRIDLKHLPKGLYHVIINYEGRIITKKITKLWKEI